MAMKRFPRLYAAASLKPQLRRGGHRRDGPFSAALCRGLIEAGRRGEEFPPFAVVFRGFMPRPH